MSELHLFQEPPPPPSSFVGAFAAVAPEVPVAGSFTYLVPPALEAQARVGVRVQVPFGGRSVRGFLLERLERCDVDPARIKPLDAVLDPEPVLALDVLELARWAADYYQASLGEVLSAAVPRSVGAPPRGRNPRAWVSRREVDAPGRLGKVQQRVWELLAAAPLPLATLRREGIQGTVLSRLEERGLIAFSDKPPGALAPAAEPPTLSAEQQLALTPILQRVEQGAGGTTLLFGVTGSGKTEVYLRAIAAVLERGRGAIVLVPEIALTPQTLERFRARFGDRVAVLHSQLSGYDRRAEWRRVRAGEATVVVGPRSAVWAPINDLGLIVVDEEHESTYKQENSPRYHARDLAVVRGKQAGVPVILGSATPSLESYRNAQRGRYRMARLLSRPTGAVLPEVRVVDMAREYADVKAAPLLCRVLEREVRRALARGERALLFQNRRGFTTFLQCKACGHVLKCRYCDISLTYHKSDGCCVCHFCDDRQRPPRESCPACLGPPLSQRGAGTERIEEVVKKIFPEARVGRLDTDVVRGGTPAEEVLGRFGSGEINILVGTQIIAKGLDIPEVTVVGVISADTSLALPDFRASERSFQLIAQVAGRAGRGRHPGQTVVQTFLPEHFAILAAAQHRYEEFARQELAARRALTYPPYGRLLKVLVRGSSEQRVEAHSETLAGALREVEQQRDDVFGVLGPAPSPRSFLARKHRWQLLIKGRAEGIRAASQQVRAQKAPNGVEVHLDVDPHHLL